MFPQDTSLQPGFSLIACRQLLWHSGERAASLLLLWHSRGKKHCSQQKHTCTYLPHLMLFREAMSSYSIFCCLRGCAIKGVHLNTNLAGQQQRLFHWSTRRRSGHKPGHTLWLCTRSLPPLCYWTASQTPPGCRAPRSHILLLFCFPVSEKRVSVTVIQAEMWTQEC